MADSLQPSQVVWAVASKADGSVIALYTTKELAEKRIARSFRAYQLRITQMNVFDYDV
jgi:hypothetical protein